MRAYMDPKSWRASSAANGDAYQNLNELGVRAKSPCGFTPRDLAWRMGAGQGPRPIRSAIFPLTPVRAKKELGRWRNGGPSYCLLKGLRNFNITNRNDDSSTARLGQTLNHHDGAKSKFHPACQIALLEREIPKYERMKKTFSQTFTQPPRKCDLSLTTLLVTFEPEENDLPPMPWGDSESYSQTNRRDPAF